MAQYIDKSALVAEIDRLKDKFSGYHTCSNYDYGVKDGRLIGYDEVLHIIDTLEVKEVDLDKEWKEFLKDGDVGFKEVAKHFFELGIKVPQKGEKV